MFYSFLPMKKYLSLRKVATIVACLVVTTIFSSCENDDSSLGAILGEILDFTITYQK